MGYDVPHGWPPAAYQKLCLHGDLDDTQPRRKRRRQPALVDQPTAGFDDDMEEADAPKSHY